MRRLLALARRSSAGRCSTSRAAAASAGERVAALLRRRLDGDAGARSPRGEQLLDSRAPRSDAAVNDDELGEQLREHALLEGDFVLRSGRRSPTTSTSTASRRGPSCSARSASASRRRLHELEPAAVRLAGPALGAVALAASASLASGLPFVIVRDEAKGYGTGKPDRGAVRAG